MSNQRTESVPLVEEQLSVALEDVVDTLGDREHAGFWTRVAAHLTQGRRELGGEQHVARLIALADEITGMGTQFPSNTATVRLFISGVTHDREHIVPSMVGSSRDQAKACAVHVP